MMNSCSIWKNGLRTSNPSKAPLHVKPLYMESPEDLQGWASQLALQMKAGTVIALEGDLGAGKTTFVQGFLRGLRISDWAQSPTFVYLQTYQGSIPVYHFDLYRLAREEDFISLGFEEMFDQGGIVVIEWPERIARLLPPEALYIRLSYSLKGGRDVQIGTWGADVDI